MIETAGYLLSELAATKWEDMVQTRIFNTLGMSNTYPTCRKAFENSKSYASPYVTTSGTNAVEAPFLVNTVLDKIGAAGSIVSTITDMLKWVSLHINDGVLPNGTALIKNTTIQELHKPQVSAYPLDLYHSFFSPIANQTISIWPHSYAFCWVNEDYRGINHVWHNGGVIGGTAQVSFVQSHKIGVVILANRDQVTGSLQNLARFVIDLLVGNKPFMSPSLVKAMASHVAQARATAAVGAPRPRTLLSFASAAAPALPLPPAAYIGVYTHPFYGTITLSASSSPSAFNVVFGMFTGNMTHQGNNVFYMSLNMPYFPIPGFVSGEVVFVINSQQQITSFSCPLTNFVAPIVFTTSAYQDSLIGYIASDIRVVVPSGPPTPFPVPSSSSSSSPASPWLIAGTVVFGAIMVALAVVVVMQRSQLAKAKRSSRSGSVPDANYVQMDA